MNRPRLIIIGAGASGLLAAAKLADHFQIKILEAKEQPGGRIQSVPLDGTIIEGGAEFIHGKLPITLKLLKSAGIAFEPLSGNIYRSVDGKLGKDRQALRGWGKLLRKMKKSPPELTLLDFLQENREEFSKDLQEEVRAYAEGFDLADPSRASAQSLAKEWAADENNNFRIPTGYISMIRFLLESSRAELLTRRRALRVDWKKNSVSVNCSNGEKYNAEKILVTVPPPLLDNAYGLVFDPPLTSKYSAARNIGFGGVIKIAIQFKKRFWKKQTGFILSNQQLFPTWWPHGDEAKNILFGWMGGPTACAIAALPEEEIRSRSMQSLSAILSVPVDELKENILAMQLFNWSNDPMAMGGYSYDTAYSRVAKRVLNQGIQQTIFFAGEALANSEHPGTVEAALESGIEAAAKILAGREMNKV